MHPDKPPPELPELPEPPKLTVPTLIVVTRNPFEIFMLAALMVSGVVGLLPHRPTAIDALADEFALTWYLGLVIGGSAALISQWAKSPFGLLMERVTMWLLSGLMLAYGVGIYVLLGWGVVGVGGALILALGLSCFVRGMQIRRVVKSVGSS